MKTIIFLVLFLLALGCKKGTEKADDPIVARVYDKYLYSSQLKHIVPKDISGTDSASLIKDHIEKWIRKELLVYQAEHNLSEEEKNVEQQIDDYRSSLLIFKYEQNYIKQKLDTTIKEEDVSNYYNEHTSNFILNNPIIKGVFVIVPKTAPDIHKVNKYYKSDNADDIKSLESYCYNYASKYEYFDESWIYFNEIMRYLPETYMKPESIIQTRKFYEIDDSLNFYFLKLSDFRLAGKVAPLEFVESDIQSILLNKRKIQKIQELESNIFNNALDRENFQIISE